MRRSWLRSFWAGLIVVGIATGYLVMSGMGERLLHNEIETQLTRLLNGKVEIGEVKVRFEGGLRLEARDVEAFPNATLGDPPAIRARRVVAWIDVLALLIGRLELSTLVLEAPFVRIEQDAEGRFRNLPVPPLELGPIDADGGTWGESLLSRIEGLDAAAEAFFESLRSADRIEILDGTAHWLRAGPPDPDSGADGEPSQVRLELFSTVIERDWLSDAVQMQLSAVFVDGRHAPFPFALAIEPNVQPGAFDWTFSMSQIPLEAAETPLSFIDGIDGLSGQLTTVVHLGSTANGARRLAIDSQIHNAIVELRRSRTRIHREQVTLNAEVEISPQRLRLLGGHLSGKKLALDLKGSLARPLRPGSRTRLESRMVGFKLEDVFDLVHSLEAESDTALAISRFVERVEGGRVRFIESAGTATLREWQDIVTGRSASLPKDFLLNIAFDDVRVAATPEDRIEGLHGEVEWIEDQLTFRDTTATFRGSPLPSMTVVLDGMNHLDLDAQPDRTNPEGPPPIPGLAPLLELIRPRDPNALPPVKAIGLAIDVLDHPLFRYPFHDLRVLIEPKQKKLDIQIREGRWGGASISGQVAWAQDTQPSTVTAHLTLEPVASNAKSGTSPIDTTSFARADATPNPQLDLSDTNGDSQKTESPSTRPTTRWGKGRFELEFRPRPTLPFRTATGYFRLEDTQLIANEVQFQIEPVGQIAARIVLDMAVAERVGVDLSFAATDALLQHISEFIGISPGLTRGLIGATGSLRGSIHPDESLIAKLDGRVRVEAHDGAIRTEVPLLLRLSRASEGYNLFKNEDELKFETLTTTIDFQQGSLLAEDFKTEGPVRLYARGRIDPLANPSRARGVVGVFLFRAPNQFLESLPLVRYFLPGSERGLIGAYFDVKGALSDPDVETLPMATLMTAVPQAIKAPFKVLQYLFEPTGEES